ncbi:MAG: endolytic transglycosylase MltG [Leptospiraceae bacterium]|nr:endolytic transglycosylase MltG [Leptospiraceae bacterium]
MATKSKKKFLKISIIVLLILVLSSGIGIFVFDEIKGGAAGHGEKKYDLFVGPGDSSSKIIRELSSHGLIKSSVYFQLLLKFTGNTNKIKQGLYEINDGMSSRKILEILVKGKVKLIHFTIPEGYNNRQIGDLLAEKKIVPSRNAFLMAAADKEILDKYKIPASTTEGYLFPETYSVPYNFPPDRIVEMLLKRFFLNLEKIEKAKNLSPEDLHQKVILASIVEREAKRKEERPMMAGVFLKRIREDINLESCATVQYLFDKPKKRLFEKDLERESPYNTYRNKGYPPGPISNPGIPAIEAAFNPKDEGYLFFLLKPDGSHYFSKTIKEHLEAKKKYIDILY